MRHQFTFVLAVSLCSCAATTDPAPAAADRAASTGAAAASLEPARALIADGKPREALAELDPIHAAQPQAREAWVLRAQACLAAAQNDTQPQFYYEDALAALAKAQELRREPALDFDAAHAARMLLRLDEAVEFAARAEAGVDAPTPAQERVLIEVAFERYIQAKQAAAETTPALQADVEARLLARLTREPADAWALNQLANLFLWEQRSDAAVDVLGQLVRATPDDEAAHKRFADLMRSVEGRESVVAFYASMRAEMPQAALAAWFEAAELFEMALAELAAKQDAVERFVRAEELFVACRAANPSFESSCKGYEVMCRAGIGWSRFNAGDDEGAEQAFLATEDVLPGGIEWQLEGRLASGFTGLMYLADRAYRGSKGEFDYVTNGEAARLYAKLRAFRPQDAEVANNCGFFHRDTGVPMLMHSRRLRAQAAEEGDAAKRAELEARAAELETQGRTVIAACCEAYKACADLAPDNVRWVNSYALMLVYHYPSRAAEAERLLLHCVEEGQRQANDESLSAEEREAVAEGWGDANQNLGMLELVHRRDPVKALMYFQRSFDIGPRPRVDRRWVDEVAMHWCREVADGKPLDLVALDPRLYLLE
jgi:hypothetical protein